MTGDTDRQLRNASPSPRIYNTPKRAATGWGVPPSKKAEAPAWAMAPEARLQIVDLKDATGHRCCEIIVGTDGGGDVGQPEAVTYVEADRMVDLLAWLTEYVFEVDRLASEGGGHA